MRVLIYFLLFPLTSFAQLSDPVVTQENIHQTICVSGYTKTVRPPTHVTNKIKLQLCRDHGIPNCKDYILDHIIPLEAGGHPNDIANFQLETKSDAKSKDKLEHQAKRDICQGHDLIEVQNKFTKNPENQYEK